MLYTVTLPKENFYLCTLVYTKAFRIVCKCGFQWNYNKQCVLFSTQLSSDGKMNTITPSFKLELPHSEDHMYLLLDQEGTEPQFAEWTRWDSLY